MINNYSSAEKARDKEREKEREKDKNNTTDIETNTPNKPLEKSEKSTPTLIIPPAPCHLTIAEIMLVVADLVSVVPGLATCVHR